MWEEPKAQIALFNSGIFRDGLGAYKAALIDREKYLTMWPESKDAEAVFLSIVDLYEKSGVYAKALKKLEDYEKKYSRDPNKILWVARVGAEDVADLVIHAQRMQGTRLVGSPVRRSVAGGPGPSIIDLPRAGCWSVDLSWSGHHDHLTLRYSAS